MAVAQAAGLTFAGVQLPLPGHHVCNAATADSSSGASTHTCWARSHASVQPAVRGPGGGGSGRAPTPIQHYGGSHTAPKVGSAACLCPLNSLASAWHVFPDLVFEPTVHALLEAGACVGCRICGRVPAHACRGHHHRSAEELGRGRQGAPPLSNSGAHFSLTACLV